MVKFHTSNMQLGSEIWTVKARDARRMIAAKMKYKRRTAGYSWTDYKTNTQITKELKITPILDKLLEYKGNWIQHVNRLPRNRLPRVTKHSSPTGRRNHGRPFEFHPDSTWRRSSKTCMKPTSAECTAENSWWWAEKMPETCRVL